MAEKSKPKRRRTAAAATLKDLPDAVLIHILTLLPLFSAIETSFISRRWRNLWHSIPTLEFYLDPPYLSISEYHLRLVNTITQVLLNRPKSIPLTVFRLAIRYFPNHRHRSLISSWLRYALDCGAEDISLAFDDKGNDDPNNIYDFHFSDIGNRQVRCLSLLHCGVVLPGNFTVRFNSLRVMELSSVDVADELLTDLISKCENLEELCLNLINSARNFRICSKSLKFLKLLNFYGDATANGVESSLELCTPNLSKIKVRDFYVSTITGDLSSVNEAELSFSNKFKNSQKCWGIAMDLLSGVELLKIKGSIPYKLLSGECSQLRRLKHLEVMGVCKFVDVIGLSLLLERSPVLETLVVGNGPEEDEDEDEDGDDEHGEDSAFGKVADSKSILDEKNPSVRFHIPCLREVKINRFRNTTNEHTVLLLLEKHKVVLSKVVVIPADPCKATVVLLKSEDLLNFWLQRMADAKANMEARCLQEESTGDEDEDEDEDDVGDEDGDEVEDEDEDEGEGGN